MGMYTAISLGVELKKDTPQYVIDVLQQMTNGMNPITSHPDHKFFNQCTRWQSLFRMDSYYFDYDTGWTFRHDDITKTYFLSGVSNLKNYDNEIEEFIRWLEPYLHDSSCGFIGWTMYEEQWAPDLIMRSVKRGDGELAPKPEIHFIRTEAFAERELAK